VTDPRPRSLWRGRLLALVGVVLVAFSLRSAVAALSPIISEVQADFAVPTWVVGLIGTAPPVCFAVFGIVTPTLERRFGLERLAAASMLIVTAALITRSLAGDAATLLLATTVLFAAVGVGNVVLPPLIKTYFPDRVGTMTALYSALLAMAAFVPPLVAVPVADAAGWRFSLGMWVTLVARANVARAQAPVTVDLDAPAPGVLGRLPRLALAWALAGTFGISAASVYACFAWLPVVLVDIAGVSHAEAGALLSLFGAMGLPWSIIVPILITRSRRVGVVYAAALIAGLTGVAGMLIAPAAATILWVVLLGTPQALFPAVLVLIQLRSRTHEGSVALSGFAQSVGYGIAALFPLMFAVVHELTGQWQPVLIVFGLLFLATIPTGLIVTRPRTIEDEWEHRHGTW